MSNESIRHDEVSEFETELQSGEIAFILNKYNQLKKDLTFFKELSHMDLSEVNRVKAGQSSDILIDNDDENRFLTPFEFNNKIEERLQSIREIKKKLYDLLVYATNPDNKGFELDQKKFSYVKGQSRPTLDFLQLVSILSFDILILEENFKYLIKEDKSDGESKS